MCVCVCTCVCVWCVCMSCVCLCVNEKANKEAAVSTFRSSPPPPSPPLQPESHAGRWYQHALVGSHGALLLLFFPLLLLHLHHTVLMGRLMTPHTSEVCQPWQVPTGVQALETKAAEREIPLHPEVRGPLVLFPGRKRLAALHRASHFHALSASAEANAACLTEASREAELHASVAVGRFVRVLGRLPPVRLPRVPYLERERLSSRPARQLQAEPGENCDAHDDNEEVLRLTCPLTHVD